MEPKHINVVVSWFCIILIVAGAILYNQVKGPASQPVDLSNGEGRSCHPL